VTSRPPSDNDTPPPGTDMRKVAEAGLDNLAEIDRLARRDRIRRARLYQLAKHPVKGLRFDDSANGHATATSAFNALGPGISAHELSMLELPPLIWAVDGMLAEGLALIIGKPKGGKSWWLLQLAGGA